MPEVKESKIAARAQSLAEGGKSSLQKNINARHIASSAGVPVSLVTSAFQPGSGEQNPVNSAKGNKFNHSVSDIAKLSKYLTSKRGPLSEGPGKQAVLAAEQRLGSALDARQGTQSYTNSSVEKNYGTRFVNQSITNDSRSRSTLAKAGSAMHAGITAPAARGAIRGSLVAGQGAAKGAVIATGVVVGGAVIATGAVAKGTVVASKAVAKGAVTASRAVADGANITAGVVVKGAVIASGAVAKGAIKAKDGIVTGAKNVRDAAAVAGKEIKQAGQSAGKKVTMPKVNISASDGTFSVSAGTSRSERYKLIAKAYAVLKDDAAPQKEATLRDWAKGEGSQLVAKYLKLDVSQVPYVKTNFAQSQLGKGLNLMIAVKESVSQINTLRAEVTQPPAKKAGGLWQKIVPQKK